MKIIILITGSLRNPAQLDEIVEGALTLGEEFSQIEKIRLVSSDEQEVVRRCTLKWSQRHNFEVIWCEPPSIIVKGHRLHQIRQLDVGLEGLAPSTWILKLRTDKLVLPIELLRASINRLIEREALHAGRVGVLEGHLFLPWYINDMAFLSQEVTLRELIRYDVAAEILAPQIATEQAIWVGMLGSEADSFLKAVSKLPQCYHFRPEDPTGREVALIKFFEPAMHLIIRYWQALQDRFFSMSPHKLPLAYSVDFGGVGVTSHYIFTRYGDWGASFTDPIIVSDLLKRFN